MVKTGKYILKLTAAVLCFTLTLSCFCCAYADGPLSFLKRDSFKDGIKLLSGKVIIDEAQLIKLRDYFANGEDERSAAYAAVFNALAENDALKAAELAAELMNSDSESGISAERWREVIVNNYERDVSVLDDWLSQRYLYRLLGDQVSGKLELDRDAVIEAANTEGYSLCTLPVHKDDFALNSLSELFKADETADGMKLLFVRAAEDPETRRTSYAVCHRLMAAMPLEFLPMNTADIDHIIVLEYTYEITGIYGLQFQGINSSGTVSSKVSAVQEKGEVSRYGINGESLGWNLEIEGPEPPDSIKSAETPFVSGGPPALGEDVWSELELAKLDAGIYGIMNTEY